MMVISVPRQNPDVYAWSIALGKDSEWARTDNSPAAKRRNVKARHGSAGRTRAE